jgi:transcriptional regulator with XRE-family HTH domain
MENAQTMIKEWMRENRKRQYQLAEDAGISPEQMSRIMGGLVPSPPVRKVIALITGLDVAEEASWRA